MLELAANLNVMGTRHFYIALNVIGWIFIIGIAVNAYLSSSSIDPQSKKGWPKILGMCLIYFSVVIGIAVCIRIFFAQPFKVPSKAMVPTLVEGDRFLADKWVYRSSDPKRGDVIVFIYPKDRKLTYVKRVVGLPHEKIEIKFGGIYVNGQLLTEPPFSQV